MPEPIITEIETWRPIAGHPDYEVSDLGRVRSLDRHRKTRHGQRLIPGQLLKPASTHGYCFVSLGRRQQVYVHALVLTAFVGPRGDGMDACHNNGKRNDNRLENLRWDTHRGNEADKQKHGTLLKGSRVGNSILSETDVIAIRQHILEGVSTAELSRRFKTNPQTIANIRYNRAWQHLPGQLTTLSLQTRSKLNAEKVAEIRRLLNADHTVRTVAEQYGLSCMTVWSIKTGRSWKHVGC